MVLLHSQGSSFLIIPRICKSLVGLLPSCCTRILLEDSSNKGKIILTVMLCLLGIDVVELRGIVRGVKEIKHLNIHPWSPRCGQ